MIPFKEDFKPSPQYKPYMSITAVVSTILASVFTFGAIIFPFLLTGMVYIALGGLVFIILLLAVFVLVWVQLYYKSIVYHLNDTEMTWKRGVWFKKTGIVPYNRITNIDISQGPVMRIFKISNLQIQTAGNSGGKAGSEISIIGMEDAEPLRAFIMDFVRGTAPVTAVTGGSETVSSAPQSASGSEPDMSKLISEVEKIRKLLEEQNK
ncbi:hypothetical protein MmiAt1_12730 [Methanimicrococcus sp. At1]|uniref:YdbS-like PH domain-containing protein n=1 Tax=Methanimicrococcus hacksteinii TaxID=3028293 RepID=A0ABU3VQI5_9EURY|nr:PH domain-containing protein [Methanimicrococcus sp. At1]MDV0445679.1 hypothetical protein [Methanimicrococcus sp. At1]